MKELIPLERDQVWSAFGKDHTWESFQDDFMPAVGLLPLVNEEVRKQYRAIRKLMAHSYYEYEFFDIAASQMSMLMEMAMVWRYQEVMGKEWHQKKVIKGEPKRDLKNLFLWLQERDLLEFTHPLNVGLLRKTRNYYAHPKKHGFGGGTHLHRIIELLFFINGLYDPYLKARNQFSFQLRKSMRHDLGYKKLTLMCGDKIIPLAAVEISFIDCSSEVPEYYLACYPCISLEESNINWTTALRKILPLKIVNLKMTDGAIVGEELLSGCMIEILPASEPIQLFIAQWNENILKLTDITEIDSLRNIDLMEISEKLRTNYYNKLGAL